MVCRYIMLKAATKPVDEARTLFGVIPPVMVLINFILVWSFGTGAIGGAALVVGEGVSSNAISRAATTTPKRFFPETRPLMKSILPQFYWTDCRLGKGIYS